MDKEKFTQEIDQIKDMTDDLVITNDEQYTATTALVRTIKAGEKAVVANYAKAKAEAHAAHKEICSAEKVFLAPLKEAETAIKAAFEDYFLKQQGQVPAVRGISYRLSTDYHLENRERFIAAALKDDALFRFLTIDLAEWKRVKKLQPHLPGPGIVEKPKVSIAIKAEELSDDNSE